jgi:DNA-binding response OmpR family regulator
MENLPIQYRIETRPEGRLVGPRISALNGTGPFSATRLPPTDDARTRAIQNDDASFDVIHFYSDDPDNELVHALEEYGCAVVAHRPGDVFAGLADSPNAAIVIDMPQLSKSFSICRQLRTDGIDLPLVTLTASVDPFDEVLGLELGADGIVSRQIHPRVLLARLRSIARRVLGVRASAVPAILDFGGLRIDGRNREVTLRDARVPLTAGEFDLLWLLAQNAGQVIRRDEVLKRLRGLTDAHESRSVDARLYRLRQRFVDVPDIAARIKTVRPYGYMFVNIAW